MTVTHRGITFQQIDQGDCLALAENLAKDGKHWHSHVLSPGCQHNPFPGYALVIEDDDAGIPFIADCSTAFPEVDRDLVKMLHGADILDANQPAGTIPQSQVLDHLAVLQEKMTKWHHHMHFPGCAFNPHPGKWSISVESPDLLVAEAFETEPVDILREVEVLYFANLDRLTCARRPATAS